MPWLPPPYPPGFEMPGIGYFLLTGGITLGFIGIVLYAVATAPPGMVLWPEPLETSEEAFPKDALKPRIAAGVRRAGAKALPSKKHG